MTERENSVFIKESRKLMITNSAAVLLIALAALPVVLVLVYALFLNAPAAYGALGITTAAAAVIASACVRAEVKKHRDFAEWLFSMEFSEYEPLELQSEKEKPIFGTMYLLDDCVFIGKERLFIRYADIKRVHASYTKFLFILIQGAVHIHCYNGEHFTVSLGKPCELKKKMSEFEKTFDEKRRMSYARDTDKNENNY